MSAFSVCGFSYSTFCINSIFCIFVYLLIQLLVKSCFLEHLPSKQMVGRRFKSLCDYEGYSFNSVEVIKAIFDKFRICNPGGSIPLTLYFFYSCHCFLSIHYSSCFNSFSIKACNTSLLGSCSKYLDTNSFSSIPERAYSTSFVPFWVHNKIPIGGLSSACFTSSL